MSRKRAAATAAPPSAKTSFENVRSGVKRRYFVFGLTFCVKVEAATDFAALLALGSFSTFEADDATLALVFSRLPFWVRADAATDFSALLALGLLKTLDAAVATFLLVDSDLAIGVIFPALGPQRARPPVQDIARFAKRRKRALWG